MDLKKSNISIKDFPQICRLCLFPNTFLSSMSPELLKLYKTVTIDKIEDEDAKLPKNICKDCQRELECVGFFVEKCRVNYLILKTILEQEKKGRSSPLRDIPDFVSMEEITLGNVENNNDSLSDSNNDSNKDTNKLEGIEENKARLKKFHCANCSKGFYTKKELVVHIKIHSETRPFACSECDMKFKFRQSLQRHRLRHSCIRPHKCDICGKRETPFICSICNKGYRSSTSLKKHKEVKHSEETDIRDESKNEDDQNKDDDPSENSNKRKCKICNKMLHKHGFGTHMRIHTVEKKKFICTICNKNFQKNSHLERHLRTHTVGERPYVCKVCGKSFKQDSDRKRHIVMHTGEKQFQCQHCGKQYYTKGSLDGHMVVHADTRKLVDYDCHFFMNKKLRDWLLAAPLSFPPWADTHFAHRPIVLRDA
ncbi:hypothetical protein NQ318_019218 [Aromia moschata]|uniref:Uncharacterized protein n=1 Tax=Aromia moschata TaxID=1265417 RepID=A0AAV8YXN5_9CUCU|nr:hypothetical protein NQ318_019218 [Aromia moschata]